MEGNETPKAGDQRNKRIERKYDTFKYPTADGGTAIFEYCGSQSTVAEVYCEHCKDWVSCSLEGVVGFNVCPRCNQAYREAEKMPANTVGKAKEIMDDKKLPLFAWLNRSSKE